MSSRESARLLGLLDRWRAVAGAVATARLRFLRTELYLGNTMPAAAMVTHNGGTRDRRLARAREARDTVAAHLALYSSRTLTARERGGTATAGWIHHRRRRAPDRVLARWRGRRDCCADAGVLNDPTA